jgi:CDP-glucose 4,6-dehydratase
VQRLVERLLRDVPGSAWQADMSSRPHEAGQLRLDSAKARERLHWRSKWDVPTALDLIWQWHCSWRMGIDMRGVCRAQIESYCRAAAGQ